MKYAMKCFWLAFIAILVFGCGGSSGGSTDNPFSGDYRSNFTRIAIPDTSVLVVVLTNGQTEVIVSDSTGILYLGGGTTTNDGDFQGSIQTRGTVVAIPVTGTFDSNSVDLHFGGILNVDTTASQFSGKNTTAITGPFTGSYTGTENGTFEFVIDSNGDFTGTAHRPIDGDVPITGHTTFFGTTQFSVNGITWSGDLFFVPNGGADGSGSWEGDGISGTWTAASTSG